MWQPLVWWDALWITSTHNRQPLLWKEYGTIRTWIFVLVLSLAPDPCAAVREQHCSRDVTHYNAIQFMSDTKWPPSVFPGSDRAPYLSIMYCWALIGMPELLLFTAIGWFQGRRWEVSEISLSFLLPSSSLPPAPLSLALSLTLHLFPCLISTATLDLDWAGTYTSSQTLAQRQPAGGHVAHTQGGVAIRALIHAHVSFSSLNN